MTFYYTAAFNLTYTTLGALKRKGDQLSELDDHVLFQLILN